MMWPYGAIAQMFSAEDPDSLRGPQFDAAWCDELAKWRHPERPGTCCSSRCASGGHPQMVVTTTPRPIAAVEEADRRCRHGGDARGDGGQRR